MRMLPGGNHLVGRDCTDWQKLLSTALGWRMGGPHLKNRRQGFPHEFRWLSLWLREEGVGTEKVHPQLLIGLDALSRNLQVCVWPS